jgi:hypothetical protein
VGQVSHSQAIRRSGFAAGYNAFGIGTPAADIQQVIIVRL